LLEPASAGDGDLNGSAVGHAFKPAFSKSKPRRPAPSAPVTCGTRSLQSRQAGAKVRRLHSGRAQRPGFDHPWRPCRGYAAHLGKMS